MVLSKIVLTFCRYLSLRYNHIGGVIVSLLVSSAEYQDQDNCCFIELALYKKIQLSVLVYSTKRTSSSSH